MSKVFAKQIHEYHILEHCNTYTDALHEALEIFVSYNEESLDDVISKGLRPIADAADLDRIIFFRVWEKERHYAGETYRWDKNEGGTAPVDDALKVLPVFGALKRWVSIISNDVCISMRRSNFEADEAAFLIPRGVMSIFIAPIYIEDNLWGVVTFQDNRNERDFDKSCTAMLRSAARLCAATIIREEKTQTVCCAMEALSRREKMLEALNEASLIMLSQGMNSFNDMMTAGVRSIADMAGFDRMVLYRNSMMPDGLHMSQIYRWDISSGGSTNLIPSFLDIPFLRVSPNLEKHLEDGYSINTPVKLLNEAEAAIFQTFGILSVAVIPVFINSAFWGFTLFCDVHNERYFEDDVVEIMRSASFLFVNAFLRADMERKTTEENEFTRKIFEATPIGLTMFNKNLNIIDCNDASIEMYGATKQYFIDRFPDFSPEYQPDGRKSMEKASELMKRTLNGETLTLEWMHNKLNGEPIPCEIKLTPAIYNGELIGLGYVYDLSNIKNLEKDIEHLVTKVDKIYYDWLTGIYNRRYFDENLNRIVKFLSRSNGIITLMMIDIDFFKDYNDTYGHREGDKCLKTVAAILEDTTMRDDDIVARYGGEEFIVVLPNTDENGARFIADNMLRNIRKHNIPHSKNDAAECVTISIGIATGKVTSMSSGENFVKSADEMLYKSKRDGRNRYNFVNV